MLWVPLCEGSNVFVGNKNVIGLRTELPNAAFSLAPTESYLQKAK
jgi:hypothetical protein